MIYNKELLAIVKSFETWRFELASVDPKRSVKVYTDHKNLEHFMITKQLNCWQAHWIKFLSKFNFKISYRSGKQGEKPDILTRQSQNLPKGIEDLQQQHQFQILLQNHQLDKDIKKILSVMFCVNTANKAIDNAVDKTVDINKENKEIINVEKFSNKFSDHSFFIFCSKLYSYLSKMGKVKLTRPRENC